jgi:copper chaperone
MKTIVKKIGIVFSISYAFLFASSEAHAQAQKNQNTVNMNKTKENQALLQLQVNGMSCQAGCANGIDKMLSQQKGILKSKTTFATKNSVIQYDKNLISEDKIIELIEEKGFKAKAQKEE